MRVLSCGLLQMDPSQFLAVHDFQVSLAARISSLARKGAELVLLPEYAAMIGAFLELQEQGDGRSLADSVEDGAASTVTNMSVAELASAAGTAAYHRWMDFFAASALSNRVYLCPGTFLLPGEAGYVNTAPIFSPDGDIVAEQGQTHVSEDEYRMGFACSTDLTTFDVHGHRMGIAIGTDVWYPEVGRILALAGVDTILAPTAVPAPYTVWRQTRGLWQVVQQNQVFGVESSLAGSWLGVAHQGRSRVFAPVEATSDGRGTLAEVTFGSIWGELVVALNPVRLTEARKAFPLFEQLNVGMYEEALPDSYQSARVVRTVPERGMEGR
ncbi:MAG: nitrilase-related carbon-nitrogen hydrolase [Clostridia bacterium]|nr:nitrilase-related carbon-nitrogen hydrolase [Clostridia bacterium]